MGCAPAGLWSPGSADIKAQNLAAGRDGLSRALAAPGAQIDWLARTVSRALMAKQGPVGFGSMSVAVMPPELRQTGPCQVTEPSRRHRHGEIKIAMT